MTGLQQIRINARHELEDYVSRLPDKHTTQAQRDRNMETPREFGRECVASIGDDYGEISVQGALKLTKDHYADWEDAV